MITSKTKVIALIGDPVQHSLSPVMRNAAFEALGLDYVYVSLQVRKEGLKAAVEGMKALGFRGFNVTMPHKKAVCALLDEIDESAEFCEAVNTVVIDEGRLTGSNTDGPGALDALKEARADLSKPVLLGAGGAGRAIAYALAKDGSDVVILNRSVDKAEALAKKIRDAGFRAKAGGLGGLEKHLKNATALCNATSVGFEKDESPVAAALLHEGLTVMDIVVEPRFTRLIRDAKAAGCTVVPGEKMLLHQGKKSFEAWTGEKAPLDVMRKAVESAIEAKR